MRTTRSTRTTRAVLAVIALAGCEADHGPRFRAAGATAPRDGGALRFSVQGAVPTLDPTVAYDELSFLALRPLVEPLVDAAADGTIEPRLAARWEISDDGLVYTFVIRDGAAFADGEPITAAHVQYALERALTSDASPFGPFLADLVGAEAAVGHPGTHCAGIVADGPRLTLTVAHRSPALLEILAMPFAAPQRASHVARAGIQLRRTPDATGPFALASWDEGRQLVLRRNPAYRGPRAAHLDELVLLENVPRDTQFLMFERGELDTAEKLASPDYLFVASAPAWQPYVRHTVGMNAYGSRMNVRVKPFDDVRVRRALNYALDKAHSAKLLAGTSVASHGALPPGLLGRDPDLAPYPHDPARARQLLAEAGYPRGFAVTYVVPSDEETEKLATSLQSDLAEVGVAVRLVPVSWPVYQEEIGTPDGAAFSFGTWIGDYADPSAFVEPLFHSRSIQPRASSNSAFYANPELDRVLDAAHQALTPAERAAHYRRAERILYDDAPWIWDYHRGTTEVIQPYVQGYAPHPIWGRDYTTAWLDLGPGGARVAR